MLVIKQSYFTQVGNLLPLRKCHVFTGSNLNCFNQLKSDVMYELIVLMVRIDNRRKKLLPLDHIAQSQAFVIYSVSLLISLNSSKTTQTWNNR